MGNREHRQSNGYWQRRNFLLILLAWTIIVTVSLFANLSTYQHKIETVPKKIISGVTLPPPTGLLWVTHGVIWLSGLAGLSIGASKLSQRIEECNFSEAELRRLNAILENQATTDSLTGIYNRRKFLELLKLELDESKRYDTPLVLIFFDIDHFKEFNDRYGHEAGDMVLQELSQLVISMIRQTDIFARFGGEEFVILSHNNDINAGFDLADKIRRGVNQHSFIQVGSLTCSFGVTQFQTDDTVESIIRRADNAMYSAKNEGRNLVKCDRDCQQISSATQLKAT